MEDTTTPTLVAPNDESVGLMESGAVKSDQEAQGPAGGGGMCSCLSVEYYKPVSSDVQIDGGLATYTINTLQYWNVDTEEVIDRLKQVG